MKRNLLIEWYTLNTMNGQLIWKISQNISRTHGATEKYRMVSNWLNFKNDPKWLEKFKKCAESPAYAHHHEGFRARHLITLKISPRLNQKILICVWRWANRVSRFCDMIFLVEWWRRGSKRHFYKVKRFNLFISGIHSDEVGQVEFFSLRILK